MGSAINTTFLVEGRPVSKQLMQQSLERVRAEIDHGGFFRLAAADGLTRTVTEKLEETVSLGDFGAIGDGETDDTQALNRAFVYLAEHGGALSLGVRRTYLITDQLILRDASNWTIDGRHSTIKMAAGVPITGQKTLLTLERCSSFRLVDLVIDGNRQNREPATESAWADNVTVRQCSRFCIAHCQSVNAIVDGFYVIGSNSLTVDTAEFTRDGVFFDCYADNCTRQGMSIINGWNLKVIGGAYINTAGKAPESGIDIEANEGSGEPSNRNILIQGVHFAGNAGFGVEIIKVGRTTDVTVANCTFERCGRGAIYMGGARTKIIANTIRDFASSRRGLIDIEAGEINNRCLLADNHFYDNRNLSGPLIYCHRVSSSHIIRNNILESEEGGGIVCAAPRSLVIGNHLSGDIGIAVEGAYCTVQDNQLSGCISNPAIWIAGHGSVADGNYLLDCKSDKGSIVVGANQLVASLSRNILMLTVADSKRVGISLLKGASALRQSENREIGYG